MTTIKAVLRPLNVWLLLLLAIGLSLRLLQLGEWSFWHDEAGTVLMARHPIPELLRITSADVHPPLYFLIVKMALALGQSEFAVRLPSALASAVCVLLTYFVGRDLFDERVALVGAAILALSPLQLYYAQEARMYAQLVMLTLFCCWCLVQALRDRGTLWWFLLTIGAALAVYTSYFAFPFLLAGLIYVLWTRKRAHIVRFLLAMAGVLVLFLPWMGVLISQSRAILSSYWMERPHVLALFTTLCAFFVGYSLPPLWIAVSLAAVLLVLFVSLNQARHEFQERGPQVPALVLLLLWGFVPLLVTYLVSLVRPVFQIRTVIAAAPAFYLLSAWGLVWVERRAIRGALSAPLLLVMLLSAWNYYLEPAFAKPPWRQAALFVNEHVRPGDVVVHTSVGSFLTFLCYEHDVEQVRLPEDPETARQNAPSQPIINAVGGAAQEMERALQGHDRAWLVVGLDHAVDYQLQQKKRFDERYSLLEESDIGGIHISAYSLER